MQHPLTIKIMMRPLGLKMRIGAIAQIDAIQVFWNFPFDRQILECQLIKYGGKGTRQMRSMTMAERGFKLIVNGTHIFPPMESFCDSKSSTNPGHARDS
jgi:hypothetical protein